jgi:hypothetical protein
MLQSSLDEFAFPHGTFWAATPKGKEEQQRLAQRNGAPAAFASVSGGQQR